MRRKIWSLPGRFVAMSAAMLAVPAMSSTPPPPPEYVWAASKPLTDATLKSASDIARFFADDVVASRNGTRIASDKAAWLAWWSDDRSHYDGRTVAHSMGRNGDGVLLVVDVHDTQDNSTNPPPPGSPRWITRSTLYRFGADRLIHAIEIAEVDSFLTSSKP